MKTKSNAFLLDTTIDWEIISKGIKRKILVYDDQLMLVKVSFEKGSIGYQHEHFHSQGSYILSGKFEVTIDNKKYILNMGDSFYVEPNLIHGVVCLETGELLDTFTPYRADFLKK